MLILCYQVTLPVFGQVESVLLDVSADALVRSCLDVLALIFLGVNLRVWMNLALLVFHRDMLMDSSLSRCKLEVVPAWSLVAGVLHLPSLI